MKTKYKILLVILGIIFFLSTTAMFPPKSRCQLSSWETVETGSAIVLTGHYLCTPMIPFMRGAYQFDLKVELPKTYYR